MERIDAHVHVVDRVSPRFPRQVSPLVPPEREAKAERLLREMDAAGIDRAVLIGMAGTAFEHHRYVAHCIARWPDRFAATGLVDMHDPDPAAHLSELSENFGIAGVRISGRLGRRQAEKAEDLSAYGLFLCAERLGLNINLYCSSTEADNIEVLVKAFPGVTVSLDHLGICPEGAYVPDRLGRPRFDDLPIPPCNYARILGLARYPNVYVKISGEYAFSKQPYPYGDMQPMVAMLYEAFGPGRMMWCSDFPWVVENPGYGKLVELIDHHLPGISGEHRAMIMGGTAAGIWFGEWPADVLGV